MLKIYLVDSCLFANVMFSLLLFGCLDLQLCLALLTVRSTAVTVTGYSRDCCKLAIM
jgi:hypothetical protein